MVSPRVSRDDDDDPLEGLLADCLARLSQGDSDPLEAICQAHPEHAAELRARHAGLAQLGLWSRAAPPTNHRIGAFELMRELGRGGMGTVYLAHQTEPVKRLAALKVISGRGTSPQALARFHAERQTLAQLVHPNIAQVLEAGSLPDGQPWYAMEFVDGQPIGDYCDSKRLDIDARLGLFLQLCDAVQFAHQQGVLHRDLKPGNVLVCERGGKPLVKVIDFGLAKALETPLAESTQLTEAGQILGTPEYMSPEQALPTDVPVDTRTDVYALGAMLYELCAGVLPFDFLGLRRQGFRALQVAVCEQEPPPPSVRVQRLGELGSDIAAKVGTTAEKLVRRLRGDLDWITVRALAKDREARYASVSELAADVRRHLAHLPVQAGPPSTMYQLRKFVRRHRLGVAFAATLAIGAAAGLPFVTWLYLEGQDHLRSFDTLQVTVDVQSLVQRETELWPAVEEHVTAMDTWLANAEAIVRRVPTYRLQLAELAARGKPEGTRGALQFAMPRDGYLYERLAPFVAEVEKLDGTDGLLARVTARRDWAKTLHKRSIEDHAAAWDEAIACIADPQRSPRYERLRIVSQVGLVPLGQDPDSTLYEFAVLQPNLRLPERRDGRLSIQGDSCIVMVLIPGGTTHVGMTFPDERLPNLVTTEVEYMTIQAQPRRGVPIKVPLDPYFLAKYELTQGQYTSAGLANPSDMQHEKNAAITLAHPVEQVSWNDARRFVERLGLDLPSGPQWEHGARAGAEAPWWCGFSPTGWHGAENLADQSHGRQNAQLEPGIVLEGFDDTFAAHCPVDALRANPFGLYHTLGNVREWTRDYYLRYNQGAPRQGDGTMIWNEEGRRPENVEARGGSYRFDWPSSRSTRRLSFPPSSANATSGLRPSRALVTG